MTEIKSGKEALKFENEYQNRLNLKKPPQVDREQHWYDLYFECSEDYSKLMWFIILVSAVVIVGRLVL